MPASDVCSRASVAATVRPRRSSSCGCSRDGSKEEGALRLQPSPSETMPRHPIMAQEVFSAPRQPHLLQQHAPRLRLGVPPGQGRAQHAQHVGILTCSAAQARVASGEEAEITPMWQRSESLELVSRCKQSSCLPRGGECGPLRWTTQPNSTSRPPAQPHSLVLPVLREKGMGAARGTSDVLLVPASRRERSQLQVRQGPAAGRRASCRPNSQERQAHATRAARMRSPWTSA